MIMSIPLAHRSKEADGPQMEFSYSLSWHADKVVAWGLQALCVWLFQAWFALFLQHICAVLQLGFLCSLSLSLC